MISVGRRPIPIALGEKQSSERVPFSGGSFNW
jgi:hypothetical protein